MPFHLEGWPRLSSATLPRLSLRALEIADAISTAAWKTLRVSHSYRRPGGGSDQRLSHLKDNPTTPPGLECCHETGTMPRLVIAPPPHSGATVIHHVGGLYWAGQFGTHWNVMATAHASTGPMASSRKVQPVKQLADTHVPGIPGGIVEYRMSLEASERG